MTNFEQQVVNILDDHNSLHEERINESKKLMYWLCWIQVQILLIGFIILGSLL
jgi:hypothetical protein